MGDRRAWEHHPVEKGRGFFHCPVSKSLLRALVPELQKRVRRNGKCVQVCGGGSHRQDGDLRIPVIPEMTLRALVGGLDEKS